jgi:hypothetical protein
VCRPATCTDEALNGSETDFDCGGSCNPCVPGQSCKRHEDCESLRCENDGEGNLVCQEPACDDETHNGSETDVDCGGDCERGCDFGQSCAVPEDCVELACGRDPETDELVCLSPTCEDGAKNAGESGVDCGGESDCSRCEVGAECEAHSDCASNSCDEVCLEAACDDGQLNQDETDVDCGGESCAARCDFAQGCAGPADCASGVCDSEQQCVQGRNGAGCVSDEGCLSASCEDGSCAPSAAGESCFGDSDCSSEDCAGFGPSATCAPVFTGGSCAVDEDCHSGRCASGQCLSGALSARCDAPTDCASGSCVDDSCGPLDLVVQSNGDGGDTEIAVSFSLATGATAVPWAEIAVLYFFSFADPPTADEAAYASLGQYYQQADGLGVHQAVGVTPSEWIYVWRSSNTGNVANTFSYTIKLANLDDAGTGLPAVASNDHSYRAGNGPNSRIVICRLTDGDWLHMQGEAPATIEQPCQYVEPDCDQVLCDAP